MAVAENERQAILSEKAPTLIDLKVELGKHVAGEWLIPQIHDLCSFLRIKDEFSDNQYRSLAMMIQQEYSYLKVSELLLFFWQLKSGKYGEFYGTIDPMRIMSALRKFVSWRNSRLFEYEAEENAKKAEQDRAKGVSREEYMAMVERGEI